MARFNTTSDFLTYCHSMLNLMEGIIPEYDRKGKVNYAPHSLLAHPHILLQIRGPSGSSVTGIVPTNAYPCLPDPSSPSTPTYIVIGANGDSIYNRLMHAINRPDLTGPDYLNNHHRVQRQAEIEAGISGWTRGRSIAEVEETMREAGVPVGRVASVKEVVDSEHMRARGAVRDVWVGEGNEEGEGWNVKMQGTFPVLDGVDPQPRWAGPDLGIHTEEVLMNDLGMSLAAVSKLRDEGVIG